MQTTSRKYSPKKQEFVKKIIKLTEQYKVIGVSSLHKVRAQQLMGLRKDLRDIVKIMVVKNRLSGLALKNAKIKGLCLNHYEQLRVKVRRTSNEH